MTDQTALTKNNSKALVLPNKLAEDLKAMIYNGKRLADAEALALAQYAVATQLNPFVGECYYLPGIGPGPGIAGWRKKADEQLEYEARRAAEPMARFWAEYTEPTTGETGDLAKGDIAVKAVLHDTLTKTAWEKRVLSAYIELVKAKVGDWDAARSLVGTEPVWTAIGIVRANENFGRDAMPRYERACKRAEKAAIRKRFPRIDLPEPAGFDADIIEGSFTVDEAPRRTPEENLSELGFNMQPEPQPEEPPVSEGEPVPGVDIRPYNLQGLKAALNEWSANYVGVACHPDHRKMLASFLDTSLNGQEAARHDFDLHVFGVASLKDVDDMTILAALKTWYGVSGWKAAPDPMAIEETRAIYNEISISPEQPKLI